MWRSKTTSYPFFHYNEDGRSDFLYVEDDLSRSRITDDNLPIKHYTEILEEIEDYSEFMRGKLRDKLKDISSIDIDPEYIDIVNKDFWDLVETGEIKNRAPKHEEIINRQWKSACDTWARVFDYHSDIYFICYVNEDDCFQLRTETKDWFINREWREFPKE